MQEQKEIYYRLIAITDRNGNDKAGNSALYSERINCIAKNIRYDFYHRIYMDFIEDSAGKPMLKSLHTSRVEDMTETEDKVTITTRNTVYILTRAELTPLPHADEANLIEMYMSPKGYHFARGIYYDADKKAHELKQYIHIGTFTDTSMIAFDDPEGGTRTACRYYIGTAGRIEFYDTLFHQQDYNIPFLIHNIGEEEIEISFEGLETTWKIASGESQRIMSCSEDNNRPKEATEQEE